MGRLVRLARVGRRLPGPWVAPPARIGFTPGAGWPSPGQQRPPGALNYWPLLPVDGAAPLRWIGSPLPPGVVGRCRG
jgi:hypothetical protein